MPRTKRITEPISEPENPVEPRDSYRPKRKKVGKVGSETIYQLDESTSCLDCFRSIPAGSLVAIQNVSTNLCRVPVCMYFAGLDSGKLKLTDKIRESRACPCPAFETGEVRCREKYAETTRALL
jgi:hypothetical protein